MCLILIAYQHHPSLRLVIAANRDEFHARPATSAHYWPDAPHVLAGRDDVAHGTWLGINRQGYVAAVTNFRRAGDFRPDARSRGALVADYLRRPSPAQEYLGAIQATAHEFNGFSLIAGRAEALGFVSNRGGNARILAPGVHGLSNALLNDPWPKVTRGVDALRTWLDTPEPRAEALLALLADRDVDSRAALPDTGIGLAHERALAPMFIVGETYGSRASTVVLVRDDGHVEFAECRYDRDGNAIETRAFAFEVESSSL